MKLGEVVFIHVYYNFTKFHQNQMKNKKVLLIVRFSVQNCKVSAEFVKIVHSAVRFFKNHHFCPNLKNHQFLPNFEKSSILAKKLKIINFYKKFQM